MANGLKAIHLPILKSSTTKISIVTPSYNQGQFLEDTLRSVIGQELGDFTLQYIIQDNCSTDITSEVLARHNEVENMHVRIQSDAGQADALNRGFRYSDGSILGWVNSDDVLLPGALNTAVEVFEGNPSVDVIYGDAFFINKAGVIQGKYPTSKFSKELLFSTCFLSQPSVFFRRSIYDKVGGVRNDLHFCLDYNLWLKFYQAGANFAHINKPLSATRIYADTKSATGGREKVDEIRLMLLDEVGYIPNCWELYYEYSKGNGFYSENNLIEFLKASCRFLLGNPNAISEVVPFVSHRARNKLIDHLGKFRIPYGKHYSYLN
ncbi:MAG: glycosyltransferase [Gammaproteobacteria bacterium]|nr:glycosyltransferase [Gammaproteobacteria bacterium]